MKWPLYNIGNNKKEWEVYYYQLTINDFYSLKTYIENYNPNYRVLNYKKGSNITSFYTDEELKNKGIFDGIESLNLSNLKLHEGIINTFGKNLILQFNGKSVEKQLKEAEGIIRINQPQETDNISNFMIARLSAPATYYILSKVTKKDAGSSELTFSYIENAEQIHGLNYHFSLNLEALPYYYKEPITQNDFKNGYISKKIVSFWPGNSHLGERIKTKNDIHWANNDVLTHELYYSNSETSFEPLFTEEYAEQNFDSDGNPCYTINVKMKKEEWPNNVFLTLL